MKFRVSLILSLFLFAIHTNTMAQNVSLDSLLNALTEQAKEMRDELELSHLEVKTYTTGISHCVQHGFAGLIVPHLLPFQTDTTKDIAIEGVCHLQYQWPGDMYVNINGIRTNQRRKGLKVLAEIFQGILPIYAIPRYRDYGSTRSYVLPFYDEGNNRYQFNLISTPDSILTIASRNNLMLNNNDLCCIAFSPKHRHHTLLDGYVVFDNAQNKIIGINWNGRIDFGHFSGLMFFAQDSLHDNKYVPYCSDMSIDYHYMKAKARNSYHTYFKYVDITPLSQLDRQHLSHDLTKFYQDEDLQELEFERLRPIAVPDYIDSVLSEVTFSDTTKLKSVGRKRLESFSESLVDGTRIGTEENRLRIYGPLDPASLGYDKFNGITIRERLRWNHIFDNKSRINTYGEIGYAFRLEELRFRTYADWIYNPKRRGKVRLEIRRKNSNFSSKFINMVNDQLEKQHNAIDFDSLGIDYFKRTEYTLEHSIELCNGLTLYAGAIYNYRTPVKHGVRKTAEERRKQLLENQYSDFAPFIRVEWTPDQYYRYNKSYKEYLDSPAPTFAFEFSRAIPGFWGTDSNYGRAEFDMQQSFHIERTRLIAYHVGCGKFFNRKGEYFINYRYFSRNQYPTMWEDDRIGGTFHLLNDHWYSSSPAYIQAHLMHETPFGILHKISPISRFIIKERIYWGALWAEGKQFYNEAGYGIDNNYFNVGFFVGFKDANFYDLGVKFRIEIGRHI